jgi:Spy/CpxP family protein refolding chaperone
MIKMRLKLSFYTFIIKYFKEYKMKKTVLASALVIGLLSTSAFAFMGDCQRGDGMMQKRQDCQMQDKRMGCDRGDFRMNHKGMQRGGEMRMFSNLDLSDEQKYKLSILHDEMRLEMKKSIGMKQERPMQKFVNENGFDEKGFKKYMDERHEKMIALRAAHMKKVFAVLTPEQIAKLKTL